MAINLSLSGGGFLGVYHVGVASCLKLYGKSLLDRVTCYGGCSAGALTAIALVCDFELEDMVQLIMKMATIVRECTLGPFSTTFKPVQLIRETMTTLLPPNAYQLASGKLFLSLTRVSDLKHIVVSEYPSNKSLINALLCTSFIPLWSGFKYPKFEGVGYIDGGFTNNLLQHFEGTNITVSPLCGDFDICPDDGQRTNVLFDWNNVPLQLTSHNIHRLTKMLYPYDTKKLSDFCRRGFNDTLKYLHCNYPEMLSLDVDIVSVPYSDRKNFDSTNNNVLMDEDSIRDSGFSYLEQKIAKSNAIKCLVFPKALFDLLSEAEKTVDKKGSIIWLFVNTFFRIVFCFHYPWYYMARYLYHSAHAFFNIVLSKLENCDYKIVAKCFHNTIVQKVLQNTKYAYQTYNDSSTSQLHPSLEENRHMEILQTRGRLRSARKSIMAVRKESTPQYDNLLRTTPNVRRRLSVSPSGLDLPRIVLQRPTEERGGDIHTNEADMCTDDY